MCGVMINGQAHGPQQTTTCQLHMRSFKDGDTIDIEPWRASRVPGDQGPRRRPARLRPDHPGRRLHQRPDRDRARGALDRRCRRRTPTPRSTRPPASAAAPAWPPARTPRRCCSPPRRSPTSACCRRASPSATTGCVNMVAQQDREGFGGCTNIGECSAVCPKGISMETISRLNHDLLGALRAGARPRAEPGAPAVPDIRAGLLTALSVPSAPSPRGGGTPLPDDPGPTERASSTAPPRATPIELKYSVIPSRTAAFRVPPPSV